MPRAADGGGQLGCAALKVALETSGPGMRARNARAGWLRAHARTCDCVSPAVDLSRVNNHPASFSELMRACSELRELLKAMSVESLLFYRTAFNTCLAHDVIPSALRQPHEKRGRGNSLLTATLLFVSQTFPDVAILLVEQRSPNPGPLMAAAFAMKPGPRPASSRAAANGAKSARKGTAP